MSDAPQPPFRRIAVIGAGIAGISCALHLVRDGHRVTVLDPREPGTAASFGNAGLIALYSCVPTATPDILVRVPRLLLERNGPLSLRWRYVPRLLPWLIRLIGNGAPARILANARAKAALLDRALDAWNLLLREAGAETLVQRDGFLKVFETDAAFARARHEIELMRRCGRRFEIVSSDEIRQLEPGLAPIFRHGLFFPDNIRILNPGRLVGLLARHLEQRGGAVVRTAVTNIVQDAGGDWRLETADGPHRAEVVVVAAGAWSHRIARMLGLRLLIEAERGYHVMLPHPEPGLRRSVAIGDSAIHLAPMEEGLRMTTGLELASVDAPPDYTRVRRMLRFAARAVRGLEIEERSLWMGGRPSMPDTVPVLGPAPGRDGIYFATGGSHIGMTLGPVMGRITADLIAGREPGLDLHPYRADRS